MKTVVVPSALYSAGTRTLEFPLPVDDQFLGVGVSMTRESWSNPAMLDFVTVIFERSSDGVRWEKIGAATFAGGDARLDDGTIYPVSGCMFYWTDRFERRVTRPGRARLTVTNRRALRTAITLTLIESTD